jgi:hypothetical protein
MSWSTIMRPAKYRSMAAVAVAYRRGAVWLVRIGRVKSRMY